MIEVSGRILKRISKGDLPDRIGDIFHQYLISKQLAKVLTP